MRSLRLVPYWSVHETLGVDAHNAPLKMRTRRIHLSRAVAWSCVRRHPVAGAALGSTDVEGSDPQAEGLVRAWSRARFHTPAPALQGSLPVHVSLAGRQLQLSTAPVLVCADTDAVDSWGQSSDSVSAHVIAK